MQSCFTIVVRSMMKGFSGKGRTFMELVNMEPQRANIVMKLIVVGNGSWSSWIISLEGTDREKREKQSRAPLHVWRATTLLFLAQTWLFNTGLPRHTGSFWLR